MRAGASTAPCPTSATQARLAAYLTSLARRLERVRITCGDWRRVLTPAVTRAGTGGDGSRAIFLDPPYATSGDLYAAGDGTVAADVREWCLNGAASGLRVVLVEKWRERCEAWARLPYGERHRLPKHPSGHVSLHAVRCPDCSLDCVLDTETGDSWTLDHTDYGDNGSETP